jgi:hypothetical protein
VAKLIEIFGRLDMEEFLEGGKEAAFVHTQGAEPEVTSMT